ncbi:DUF4394 domain-containing protein [Actinomycetes bacterium KLBMP 9797]
MKAWIKKGIAVAAALATTTTGVVVGLGGTSSAAVMSLPAFGITGDGRVMAAFTTDQPDVLNWVRVIRGLVGDTALIGIDFRVQDGLLYGVGNQGGIYTVQLPTGSQDPVVTKVSQLTVPLYGTFFGVDFNPAADRLRVVSDNGQNLSHNVAGSTTEQTTLTTPPDTGPTRGVSAAAYTNNDLHPDTNTTLFDINTTTDQVVIQSPPQFGFLVATGALGVDAGANAGLDIFSDLTNGKTTTVFAFGAFTSPSSGVATLYDIHLITGRATRIGDFPLAIADIAIGLDTN